MKKQSPPTSRAFSLATTLFLLLIGIIITTFLVVDLSSFDVVGLLFMTSFMCAGLLAKSVYDSLSLSEQIARTEEQITKDVFIASEELHTQLYQNSPIPYVLLNEVGTITSANMAAGRLYGVTQHFLEGKNVFETLLAEEPDRLAVLIEKYRKQIPIGEETLQIQRFDGTTAWVLLSLFQYTNAYGTCIGLLTLVDISKQKQIENAKAEFVSLASHQLRTPLAAVKWSTELLLLDTEESLTEKQKKYINRLLRGVERMGLLIDDFLRVSRFELGTFQPVYEMVTVGAVLDGVIREQEEKITQKQLQIVTAYEPKNVQLRTDVNLLRMIISNIFSNAVKYAAVSGSITLSYVVSGDTITFSVTDNGMGIPVAEQDRIFSKLFRASNAARNVPDGTGLGLYIAKEATHVLKGKIEFTSVPNVQTTFSVRLPFETTL